MEVKGKRTLIIYMQVKHPPVWLMIGDEILKKKNKFYLLMDSELKINNLLIFLY